MVCTRCLFCKTAYIFFETTCRIVNQSTDKYPLVPGKTPAGSAVDPICHRKPASASDNQKNKLLKRLVPIFLPDGFSFKNLLKVFAPIIPFSFPNNPCCIGLNFLR